MDLTSYEKSSLYRFLALYLGSVFILLAVIGYLFFQNSANSMSSAMRFEMLYQARMIESKLLMAEDRGESSISKKLLPKLHPVRFKVGFFDKSKNSLYSQIDVVPMFNKNFYGEGEHCYSVVKFPGSKLDVGYIVLREDELKVKLHRLKREVILYLVALFAFMSLIGYFLARLFLKPIRERIESLDRFIEDTTHELNTPISAILMTIQTLKDVELKKLNRLKASANRLSVMYDTLSFSLKHDSKEPKEQFNLKEFIENRVETIKPLANSRAIRIDCKLDSLHVSMSKESMRRLIDNVLSNAIKYSDTKGLVEISLQSRVLSIKDRGIGISKEEQSNIFKRYQRFNKDRGGFGIGLSIVMAIANENGIKVSIDSAKGEGSEFRFDLSAVVK